MKRCLLLIALAVAACTQSAPRATAAAGSTTVGPQVAPESLRTGGVGDTTRFSSVSPSPATRPGMGGMMSGRMSAMMGRMMGTAKPDTSAAPSVAAGHADSAADCPAVSQALVNAGRSVFSSTGTCFACHGANARGTALAPNLTDAQWLDIDGSYASIAGLVRDGVPSPKRHSTPMPPLGGAALSPAQVCAVSAYVYSLGHH